MEKAVLHKNTPMHCKARPVLLDFGSTNQGNGSEITFVAEAYKTNLKDLKPSYDWVISCRKQSEGK